MSNPSLQNDFSFYRRSLNRIRAAQQSVRFCFFFFFIIRNNSHKLRV
jgi:hypothetical protein